VKSSAPRCSKVLSEVPPFASASAPAADLRERNPFHNSWSNAGQSRKQSRCHSQFQARLGSQRQDAGDRIVHPLLHLVAGERQAGVTAIPAADVKLSIVSGAFLFVGFAPNLAPMGKLLRLQSSEISCFSGAASAPHTRLDACRRCFSGEDQACFTCGAAPTDSTSPGSTRKAPNLN